MDLTPAIISATASAIQAILLEWLPGLSEWFAKRTEQQKKTTIGILLVITAFLSVLWSCEGRVSVCVLETDWRTWIATVFAALTSQPVHRLTKKADEEKRKSKASRPRGVK